MLQTCLSSQATAGFMSRHPCDRPGTAGLVCLHAEGVANLCIRIILPHSLQKPVGQSGICPALFRCAISRRVSHCHPSQLASTQQLWLGEHRQRRCKGHLPAVSPLQPSQTWVWRAEQWGRGGSCGLETPPQPTPGLWWQTGAATANQKYRGALPDCSEALVCATQQPGKPAAWCTP